MENPNQTIRRIQVTNVYARNAASQARYLVNVGGARSSKSHSIAQRHIEKFINIPNRKIAVCRKTLPALRLTAYKLTVDLLKDYGLYDPRYHNKTEHIITNPRNNAMLAFLSVDDPRKMLSTEWNDIWGEEANEFTWADWLIMQTRLSGRATAGWPNQITLSLNPTDEQGWINQKLMLTKVFAERLEVIHSTYRDNPYLDDDYKLLLASLKDQDPIAFQVFSEGLWGTLTNIIYQPYTMLPIDKYPQVDETIYGVDFGYNVPSAVIEIGIQEQDDLYLQQLVYETHLTNSQLIDRCKTVIAPEHRSRPMYADNAEPNRIQEFCDAGFNMHPADKDVGVGIDTCKRKRFYTNASNPDLNKERASYKWREDKNGNVLEEPVKYMDHAMDAKRYAVYTHMKNWARRDFLGWAK